MSNEKKDSRYESLVEASPNGIATVNKIGIITFCNTTFLKLTGYSEGEIVGKHISKLPTLRKKDIPGYLKLFAPLFKGRNIPEKEFVYITKSGETRFAKAIISLIKKEGKVSELLLILRDVTDEKNTEKVLEETERKFRQLVENTSDIIMRIRVYPELQMEYISPSVRKVLGYSQKENYKISDLGLRIVHPDDRSLIEGLLKGKHDFKKPVSFRLTHKKGNTVWFEAKFTPIYNKKGQLELLEGIARDITERKNAEEKLKQTLSDTIKTLSSIIETRDPYTSGHQKRVAQLAASISDKIGLTTEKVEAVYTASLLHDIGKINIPSSILARPGKISEIEYSMIKTHPQLGYDVIKNVEFPWPIADIILQHHEKEDGSGYPNGLKGKDILIEAKILLVADVVEAMCSHRPYRPMLGIDKALGEIKKNKGKLYDPKIVDACIELFREKDFKFNDA